MLPREREKQHRKWDLQTTSYWLNLLLLPGLASRVDSFPSSQGPSGWSNGSPRVSLQPYVVGVTSYNSDGIYGVGTPIYLLLSFSEPVRVNVTGGLPTLAMATGSHFNPTANNAMATFLAGGVGTSRKFWKEDTADPIRTGLPLPCKAGSVFNPSLAGDAYCLFQGPETRVTGSMDSVLAFSFTVATGQMTQDLDYISPNALALNGAVVTSKALPGVVPLLTLPLPGNAMTGATGTYQSLSYNKNLMIGSAYVTKLTSSNSNGRYGLQPGGTPDVILIKVGFSSAVSVTCSWSGDTCPSIQLVLDTGPITVDTTTNTGQAVFPTGYLVKNLSDPSNTLSFRYVVRRGDVSAALTHKNQNGLLVNATAGASILRIADNTLVHVTLPPIASPYGLGQMKSISIAAAF